MADFEEKVTISVSGADQLARVGAEAEGAAKGVEELKDELSELGAAGAGADGAAASLGHVRDEALEAAAAVEASKASLDGFRDSAGRLQHGGGFIKESDLRKLIDAGEATAKIDKSLGGAGSSGGVKRAIRDMEQLKAEMRSAGIAGSEAGIAGHEAIDQYADSIAKARQALEEAAPYIDDSGKAIGDSARQANIAQEAMDNWRGAVRDFGAGHGDAQTAIRASRELDGVLGDFGRTTEDATQGLEDLGKAGDEFGSGGGFLSSIGGLGGFGGAFGKVGSGAQSAAMPAAIVGIASAITTIGPALVATGAGFASWGALAAPALLKVKDGLTSVTTAQQAYQQAAAVEKLDPTKAHMASEKAALDQLKATWATIPENVRPSVKAVQGLESAFSKAGKPIQADALKDIPKAIKDIKGLLPAVQGMAKATNPLINGMLKDFGKFEKSSGFEKFLSNIKSEIPGLAGPLKQVGAAFGAIATALFSKSNVKIGDQFLSSLGGFAKEFGPGTVKSLGSVAKDLTEIMNVATKAANSPAGKLFGEAMGVAGKVAGFSWKTVPKDAARVIGDTGSFGATAWDKILGIKPGTNLGAQTRVAAGNALNLGGKNGGDLKIKVSVEGAAKARADVKGVSEAAGKGKDVKIKVSAEGADKAKGDIKSVATAAQSVGKTKADLKIQVTGAQAAVTGLRQVGQAGTAMGTGVAAGAGRASAAVSAMAGSMRGAIAPLPGEFEAIGAQAGAGMAAGISSETGAVSAAAHSLAAAAESAASTHLQISSPSKKFVKIGQQTWQGFVLGLEGGQSQVDAAIKALTGSTPFKDSAITSTVEKLRTEIDKAAAAGKINPLQKMGLTQLLDQDNGRLMTLANKRQTIINKINAAEALAKSVQQAAAQGADLGTIAGSTIQGQQDASAASGAGNIADVPTGPATLQEGLQDQLGDIQKFNSQMKQLKKEGLDKAGLKELANDGVQAGSEAASQILAGGKKGVQAIAKLDNSIGLASKKLGVTAGNAAYEGASQIGDQLAAGLKDSLKAVDKQMASLDKSLMTAIMTALGDSPKDIKAAMAKLDKELGLSSGASGGSSGGKVTPPHIINQPKTNQGRFAQPGPIRANPPHMVQPAAAGFGSSAAQPITITLTSNISVSGRSLAKVVQTKTLQRAASNTSSGLVLPGRTS